MWLLKVAEMPKHIQHKVVKQDDALEAYEEGIHRSGHRTCGICMLTPLDLNFGCFCGPQSSIWLCCARCWTHSVYNPKAHANQVRQFIVGLVDTKSLGKATGSNNSKKGSGQGTLPFRPLVSTFRGYKRVRSAKSTNA